MGQIRKTRDAEGIRGLRARPLTLGSVLLFFAGFVFALFSLRHEHAEALASGDDSLRSVARIAQALAEADRARIHALLARVRVELRGHESWQKVGASGDDGPSPADTRLNDTMLRRALEGSDDLVAIELVVADGDGVSLARVEPDGVPGSANEGDVAQERARALWYADEVAEAVAGNGRRMTRGAVSLELAGERTRAVTRVALGLHDPGELVQGALVATVDLGPLGRRLSALATRDVRFALFSENGTAIGSDVALSPEQVAERIALNASAKTESESEAGAGAESEAEAEADAVDHETAPIVESGASRSLVMKLAGDAGDRAGLVVWVERAAPPGILAGLLSGPWGVAIAVLGMLVGLSVYAEGLLRRQAPAAEGATAGRLRRFGSRKRNAADEDALDHAPASLAEAASAGERPGIRRERFVLRDWLADVRGCLEREAASRGLTLDLRCERSLPKEIEQDPLWLGGLLVSLGREALDATRATRVALEVFGGTDRALHVEVDAGDTELAAIEGMLALAEALGATVAGEGRGRLSVVVPDALT